MIPFIKKYLFDNWEKLNLGDAPDNLYFIKFEDRLIRSQDVSIITFLVKKVINKREIPFCIIKIPRYPANQYANLTINNEFNNLTKIHNQINGSEILKTIPKIIFMEKINNSYVLAESFLDGIEMSQTILSKQIHEAFVENFDLALNWLANFQNSWKNSSIEANEESIENIVKQEIQKYSSVFPEKAESHGDYFNKLIDKSKQFANEKIPIFPQQMDFHASNIFIDRGQISGVIDWEDFSEDGIPFFDLFHFITTYFEALYSYSIESGYPQGLETLTESSEWKAIIINSIDHYCSILNINSKSFEILLPLFVIKSLTLAADPRKKAETIIPFKEMLLCLEPKNINDLLSLMALPHFSKLLKKAERENDTESINHYKSKIENLLSGGK